MLLPIIFIADMRGANQFVFINGKLVPKPATSSPPVQNIVSYAHTHTPTPDQYYTDTIKEYKKQINDLRRKYSKLQRSYWGLLGYRAEEEAQQEIHVQESPRMNEQKSDINLNSTNVPDSDSQHPSIDLVISSFQIDNFCQEIEQTKKRLLNCSVSTIDELNISNWTLTQSNIHQPQQSCRTEPEEDQINEKLLSAFIEIDDLKHLLSKAEEKSGIQLEAIRRDYEEHIRKLQQILERERKNSRMLNNVITRLRGELGSKDGIIRQLLETKAPSKSYSYNPAKDFKTSKAS